MRPLILTQNITVDGRVEMLDAWFDPTDADEELVADMARLDATNDAILLGRQTFEDFRGYWPQRTDDRTGAADHLSSTRKYVVSTTLADPEWERTTVLPGDPVEEVRALKESDGREIVCTGSIRLSHALLAAGLVDVLRLYTYPAVQGRGRSLFPDGVAVPRLRRLEHQAFAHGVTYVSYALDAGAGTR